MGKTLDMFAKVGVGHSSCLSTKEYFTMELICSPGGIVVATNMPMRDELKKLLLNKWVGVFLKL